MAEASIQFLLENLSSLIKAEIGLVLGVNDEMNRISSNLTTIQAVLQDAEDKQFENEAIRDWLRKLNHLSFEIEDVLDECVTELGRLEYQSKRSKVFSIKKILYKRKIARRMKEVAEKLDAVAAERAKFHLHETTLALQSKLRPAAMRETGSMLNEPELVFGRDGERDKIIDILLNKVRDRLKFSVLPIIGLGGLGKTTLAQLVFNDDRVTEHFDIKLWVCVSDDFDHKNLIKAMVRSATKGKNASDLEHLDLDALQHKLSQLLHHKRYLLVLDDVWNENQEKWSVLKNQLACGSTGSSIIVTTRLKKVADIMATTPAHNLNGLSEENCWLLFKERAFGHEEGGHTELEAIGRKIVKKCAGVPLAATTLGGLLRFERREEDWLRVKESPIWNLPQEESSILPALRLSYNHLPFTHRHCFAYCAIYPKDTEIGKEELIRQWMAHGYISSDGTSEVEETGDKIFNELVLRSLILHVTADSWGRISFKMHDLVHDLAQSIMENKVPGPQAKRDSTLMSSSSSTRQVNLRMKHAAFPSRIIYDVDLFSIFANFNRLRSLDAWLSGVRDVPPTIGKLKQLRYLNLSHNSELKMLPETLCSLWNLKILNLNYCNMLERLPKGMRELRNLRYLFLEGCVSLTQMPPKIGELTSLKTMSMFVAGEAINNRIGELQSLDLGGNLKITHLERVREKYIDANTPILAEKLNLRSLELVWERGHSSSCRECQDEKALKALEPHANVEAFKIVGFEGKCMSLWSRRSTLQIKLAELCIEKCRNCKTLPQVVVELPHLKKLVLEDLQALEYIAEDEGCDLGRVKFPVLEELRLSQLENLKGLLQKETGEFFPNLQKLQVRKCSSLRLLPQLSSLVDLTCSNRYLTGNFDRLSSLSVRMEVADICVPKECLTNNLTSLEIFDVTNEDILPEEGLKSLNRLTRLSVWGGRLTCLPGRWMSHLTSVESLDLSSCDEMVEIADEIKYLRNLESLSLHYLPKMVCLPNGLQHCTAMRSLFLNNLELESLPNWLGNLTSLHELSFLACQKLVSIPSSIQQLSQLNTLRIDFCPELQKRCEKGKGEYWHKIAHIPNILSDS